MPEINFRPCRPDDADAAIPLIYSSGPAAFDYVFCDSAAHQSLDFLRYAFVRGQSEFGYRQHLAAEIDGKLVGVAALRDAGQNFAFTVAALRDIVSFYSPAAALRTLVRGLRTERVIRTPKSGEAMLYHLGIDAEHRGGGIGTALIGQIAARARSRSVNRLTLDVAATNPRARELYLRLGFEMQAGRIGKLSSPYGQVCDHTAMSMRLCDGRSTA
ncbi:GNAT family N-acetyltransferase [Microbulbifer magnicolonia]|uniref:GNAT family N-acetyltransferase n=1 Tax=Microbulbifer magnicolonia TaxID=3109744 RepID=UPI002B416CC9|nr:GNAT family N-acetyltransferase [Microbulbifer sp. GG15]